MDPIKCVKEIGKFILTEWVYPFLNPHFNYWWLFDNNIEELRAGIRDLDRETFDMNQKIEEARLRTENLRPGVEDWANSGTEKVAEAKRILQDDNIPKAWKLISRYSMGKTAKKTAEKIAKHRDDGHFNRISDPAAPPSMGSTSHGQIMDGQIMDFGSRKQIKEEIIESLIDSRVSMIGICGMGGLGKTTMVESIRKRVKDENLFDEVVMVVVGQQVDMLKIQKEIAELLGLTFNVESMSARAHQLRTRLMDSKKKIIIFDDVWESLKFEDLGIPFERGFERCKILLTSRSTDICKRIKNKKVFKLKILEEEEAWIFFKELVGDCIEDKVLNSVAKHIVAECKGLPIALVTVGTALREETSKYKWEDSLSQLRRSNPIDFPEVLADVYKPLKLSYDRLDSDRERDIFLLCCLFPEDYNIPVEQLTWFAMGLRIFDQISSVEEARNRTHRLVEKLKSRFLLIDGHRELDVNRLGIHVKMHDVVRDVAIYIGEREKDGFLKSLPKTSLENSYDLKCNWMSVDISNGRMEAPVRLHFSKLRLLMLLNSSYKKFSGISFEGIGDLNVLSFSYISIGSISPTLRLLENLRTLYLYYCTVENISVIGALAGLEILCCHRCYNIKELPADIGRLNRLRLMEFYECLNLQSIPFGIISSLVQLEELKIARSFSEWETGGERRNAAVTELGSLPNLTCLEIEISDWYSAAQEICLSQNLVKYSITASSKYKSYSKERDYDKVIALNLPSNIGVVGNWIQMLLRNTESLNLEGDGSNNFNIAKTENLRSLRVNNCSTVKTLVKTKDCKFGTFFPFLERLNLHKLENLEEICDGTIILIKNVSLCNLKSIDISYCSNLRSLFSVSVARCLLQLEVLKIEKCGTMEQVFWNEITDDTDASLEFPKLKTLRLETLPNLTALCHGLESIRFPKLTEMWIGELPKFNCHSLLDSEPPHDHTTFHFLCNHKVEMVGLKILTLISLEDNIRNVWCRQIPINFFNNIEEFSIFYSNGIRSLMSYSIAKNLGSLKYLDISGCQEMVEVIDNDKQVVDIECLFPTLKKLSIRFLPKLRSFWQLNCALELPLLEEVFIYKCPVMETLTLGSLNTPNIKSFTINSYKIDNNKDLNHVIHHFWTKQQKKDEDNREKNNIEVAEDKDEDEGENENEDEDY